MKKFSPVRPLSKTKSVTSDHFPLIVTFTASFCTKTSVKKPDSYTMWNTNKDGGWSRYKEMTEEDDLFTKAFGRNVDNDDITLSNTESMENIDKIMNKLFPSGHNLCPMLFNSLAPFIGFLFALNTNNIKI